MLTSRERILILPDRNTADPLPASLLTSFPSGATTVPNDCESMDAQSRFFTECSAALDYWHPNDIGHTIAVGEISGRDPAIATPTSVVAQGSEPSFTLWTIQLQPKTCAPGWNS
jgi:hypothetical protein